MSSPVPVFDLARARDRIEGPLLERWQSLLERTAFVMGEEVATFERDWAEFLGARESVGVANGTDALTLLLRALDVHEDDGRREVLVPAFTFFASYESVVLAGATPVLVDIDPRTYHLDLERASEALSDRTVGVVAVHLYGTPVDAAALDAFCEQHGLWWVEDAAQAHGAKVSDRRVGTLGRGAAWSFYPSKNLGCFGDGGAVSGMEPETLDRVRCLANHGQSGRYRHEMIGTNSRLDALQAAVLNCRLPLLDEDNEARARVVEHYRSELEGVGDLEFQQVSESVQSAWHLATLRTAHRDDLQDFLGRQGIGSAVHYPMAIAEQPALPTDEAQLERVPEARRAGREVLSLPLFPELREEEAAAVCAKVREFFANR